MNELAAYLGFAAVSLMMAISPGPSWVYTISTTLGQGWRAGMIANLGNSTGILFHALAATAGLAVLLSYSVVAFEALKLIGAAYLVYLGIRAFYSGGGLVGFSDGPLRSPWQIYRDGALVNILNPKVSILFIALLPQFVAESASAPRVQIAIMGAMHAVIAYIVLSQVVVFSEVISTRAKVPSRIQQVVKYAMGTLFIGFGIRMALGERVWRLLSF
jgi:threonine/homoserine/homoserine lactone efflux protein